MKKHLIAALLGVAFAGTAQAQAMPASGVTLYGIVDGGLRWDRTKAGTLTSVVGGGASGSRLGVRGTEELGNGLKANFVLEQGVDISDNSVPQGDVAGATPTSPRASTGGRFFSRVATVGLSGAFGNIRLGRDYTPHYNAWSVVDPFGAGTVGTVQNIASGSITRFDNGIYYDAPTEWLYGLKASLALRLGESTTSNSAAIPAAATTATVPCSIGGVPANLGATCTVPTVNAGGLATAPNIGGADKNGGNAYSLSLGYASGPVYAAYGFNHVRNAFASARTRSHVLAGTYDFGMAKAHGVYWTVRDNSGAATSADARSWALGASTSMSGFNLMASYGRLDDRSGNNFDARFVSLGAQMAVSRRTDFYGAVSRMTNRNDAHYLITDASGTGLQTSVSSTAAVPAAGFIGNVPAGYSPTAVQVGVRHRF